MGVRRHLWVEHYLHDASPVPQVDEHETAVVAPAVDPARERDLTALVLDAQRAAANGFQQGKPLELACESSGL